VSKTPQARWRAQLDQWESGAGRAIKKTREGIRDSRTGTLLTTSQARAVRRDRAIREIRNRLEVVRAHVGVLEAEGALTGAWSPLTDGVRFASRNITVLQTAHTLAFGRTPFNDRRVEAQRAVMRLLALLHAAVFEGPAGVKRWAHERRLAATGAGRRRDSQWGRGVTRERLHDASTVARAVVYEATKAARDQCTAETRLRITSEKNRVSAVLRTRFRESVKKALGHRDAKVRAEHACARVDSDHAVLGIGRAMRGQHEAAIRSRALWTMEAVTGVNDPSPRNSLGTALSTAFNKISSPVAMVHVYGRTFDVRIYQGTHVVLQIQYNTLRDDQKNLVGWQGIARAIRVARPTAQSDARRIASFLVARKLHRRAVAADAGLARAVLGFGFPRLGARPLFSGPDPVAGQEPSDEECAASLATVALWSARLSDARRALGGKRVCGDPERWFRASFSTLAALRDSCERLAARDNTECDVTAVADATGKLRGITRHDPDLVRAARGATACLLAALRSVPQSAAMLANAPVDLSWRGDAPVVAYSADLSAATDHIGNDLARDGLEAALEAIEAPRWLQLVARHITSTVRVRSLELAPAEGHAGWTPAATAPVTCGALMGLGPGWVTLSLLNRFAALSAGAQKASFAVCGDDLVAVWPEAVCNRYEANLAALGLIVNKTKSFRGDGAVFCEQYGRLTRRTGRWRLLMQERVCLAEASAVTTRVAGVTVERGLASVDRLRDVANGLRVATPPVRALARLTAMHLAFHSRKLVPGALADGGSGQGAATGATVRAFAVCGAAPTEPRAIGDRARRIAENTKVYLEQAGTRGPGSSRSGPKLSEARAEIAQRVVAAEDLSHSCETAISMAKTRAALTLEEQRRANRLRAEHVGRAKAARGVTGKEAINSTAAKTRFTAAARRKASHLYAQKRYAAAIDALRRGERTTSNLAPGECLTPFLPESNLVVQRRLGLSNPQGAPRP